MADNASIFGRSQPTATLARLVIDFPRQRPGQNLLHCQSGPAGRIPALAQFAPRQSFSTAAGRRYDGQQRGGFGPHSELTFKPRPQKIGYGQPRGLILISPATEHHKDAVAIRCVLANGGAVPSHRIRLGDEDAARTGARTQHVLSFARSIGHCDREMLPTEEFRDFLLHVGLARHAQIWTQDELQPNRERKRKDEEPFKRGGTIHAAHLLGKSQ